VQVAGPLGISHFMIFSATERSKYLKICRTPRGPTLSFRVHKYTLSREVAAAQKAPRAPPNAFLSPPLVVRPRGYCSPLHRMPFNSTDEVRVQTSKCDGRRSLPLSARP